MKFAPQLLVLLALVLSGSQNVHAQYKCKNANGAVTFQQIPCEVGTQQERIRLYEATPSQANVTAAADYKIKASILERQRLIDLAISNGQPMVSMTRQELDRAMGGPNKVNAAQYGASLQDQIIYYRNGRTIYVYTKDGIVTSIQNTAGVALVSSSARVCASESEIKDIEFEINKLMNRDNQQLQTMLHKKLIEAKACR